MSHSKLAPSSFKRTMCCPAWVKFSEQFPKPPSSKYADEGTAAHALGEFCLTYGKKPHDFLGRKMKGHEFSVTKDMADAVKIYVDYVESVAGLTDTNSKKDFQLEKKLDLSFIDKDMPFGTSDCIIRKGKKLWVIDYKNGAGISVDAHENLQMIIYGLGADPSFSYEEIEMVIVQPRAQHSEGGIRSYKTGPKEMREWLTKIQAAAAMTRWTNAPLASGDHCKFCPCAGGCPQQKKDALAITKATFSPIGKVEMPKIEKLTHDQIRRVIENSDTIKDWLSDVSKYVENQLIVGKKIEGFKLVQKRSNRKWRDEATLEDKLMNYPVDPHEKVLKGITTIEEELLESLEKKEVEKLMNELTFKPDNGPTLALATDKRKEYVKAKDVFGVHKSFLD